MKELCCENFSNYAVNFKWFYYEKDNGDKVYCMPCLSNETIDWRINFCPSCGKSVRAIEITEEQYKSFQK